MRVHFWSADMAGSGWYRAVLPAMGLSWLNHEASHHPRLPRNWQSYDTIVGCRVAQLGPSKMWVKLKDEGKRLILDLVHFATAVERLTVAELPPGPVFALDPEGDDIRGVKLPDDAVLAFGSERSGLSPELRARADHLVALPMRPQVSSYNLATSVAMTLYHWSLGAS